MTEVEIAREEVKEECGYVVPVENFHKILTFPRLVGVSGAKEYPKNIKESIKQNIKVEHRHCLALR